jgi:TM2 domain-containing membrane protein YozV
MPSAYAAPQYPMPQPQYPMPAPAPVVQVVVQQQPMLPMAMSMTMPLSSAMVSYGHGQPTGVVRVGNANRTVFAILAFLLGFIGLHKFYQGKPVWGLIYLLTFWTGVPAMVSVIEGLIALFQSDAAFDADNNLRSV